MVTRMTEKTQEEISKRTYATVRAMARDILEFDLLILPFGAFGLVAASCITCTFIVLHMSAIATEAEAIQYRAPPTRQHLSPGASTLSFCPHHATDAAGGGNGYHQQPLVSCLTDGEIVPELFVRVHFAGTLTFAFHRVGSKGVNESFETRSGFNLPHPLPIASFFRQPATEPDEHALPLIFSCSSDLRPSSCRFDQPHSSARPPCN